MASKARAERRAAGSGNVMLRTATAVPSEEMHSKAKELHSQANRRWDKLCTVEQKQGGDE